MCPCVGTIKTITFTVSLSFASLPISTVECTMRSYTCQGDRQDLSNPAKVMITPVRRFVLACVRVLPSGRGVMRPKNEAGRWVLVATISASSMAFIDGTALNVALNALQTDL